MAVIADNNVAFFSLLKTILVILFLTSALSLLVSSLADSSAAFLHTIAAEIISAQASRNPLRCLYAKNIRLASFWFVSCVTFFSSIVPLELNMYPKNHLEAIQKHIKVQ